MSSLSQWLQLMLAEITRKQEDLERARVETDLRTREQAQVQQLKAARARGARR
jgi:phage terminase Nu1 subunit (DNA packaging protein)